VGLLELQKWLAGFPSGVAEAVTGMSASASKAR
jgi:hypothetical protein